MDNETAAMDIIGAFDIPGRCIGIKANKQGHINSTFISVFRDGDVERKYTHQRINSTVFPHPEEVMENILRVTEHLARKTAGMPDAERRTLRVIPARDGKPYAVDSEGMYWRTYSFIDGVVAYGRVPDEGIAYSLGKGIGTFQSLLSDFDGSSLHTVIPHFHDMGMRYRQLRAALASDPMNRKEGIQEELDFGAGAYYYADIPEFEKYLAWDAFKTSLPYLLYLAIFLVWGFCVYKIWVWVDKRKK